MIPLNLNTIAQFTTFAQEYNCDAYGAGAYGVCETTGTGTSTGSSQLVDTGITVGIFVIAAVVIMLIALLIRYWRKNKKSKAPTAASTNTRPAGTTPPKTDE